MSIYSVNRFFIRLFRVAIACIIGVVLLFGLRKAIELLSKPFAETSPIELILGLLLGLLCVGSMALPFLVAFGPGETRRDYELRIAKQREEYEEETARQSFDKCEKALAEHHFNVEASYQAAYSIGRFCGRIRAVLRHFIGS